MPQGGTGGSGEKPRQGQVSTVQTAEKGGFGRNYAPQAPATIVDPMEAALREQQKAWNVAAMAAAKAANPFTQGVPDFDLYSQGWGYGVNPKTAAPGEFDVLKNNPSWQKGQVQAMLWKKYNPFEFHRPSASGPYFEGDW